MVHGRIGTAGNETIYISGGSIGIGIHHQIWALGGDDILYGWTEENPEVESDDELYGDRMPLAGEIQYNPITNPPGVAGDDIIYGGGGHDKIYGDGGNDFLIGDKLVGGFSAAIGRDTLDGGEGDDWLYAGDGNDSLYGGDGDDFFSGTFGSSTSDVDTMTGGRGNDVFSLGYNGSYTEISYLSSGYGIITDFRDGFFGLPDNDKIRMGGSIDNYTLEFENLAGTLELDTAIYYFGDLIAVVQDTTDVVPSRDFIGFEDDYEPNDTQVNAYDFTAGEQTWLSTIDGLGVANNQDWYEIEVLPTEEQLVVDLKFTHAYGDLELALYNESGIEIASSTSGTDNESINLPVEEPGIYYLKVYPYTDSDAGNTYDLWWGTFEQEDSYELNNTLETAYDITGNEQTWLNDINGLGVANNEDWYKVETGFGYENLIVNLEFTHADGDIDLILYDSTGTEISRSDSATDNESIRIPAPAGIYYLEVYPYSDPGNTYDLWWDDVASL